MKLKFIIFTAILALTSCTPQNEMQAELLMDEVISIKWKGSCSMKVGKMMNTAPLFTVRSSAQTLCCQYKFSTRQISQLFKL